MRNLAELFFSLFVVAFISSAAHAVFPHTFADPGNATDTFGGAGDVYSGFATIR